MASNPSEAPADDFLEQILGIPTYPAADPNLAAPMVLQLGSGDASGHIAGGYQGTMFPLGLRLEQGKSSFLKPEDASGSGKRFREDVIDGRASTVKNVSFSSLDFFRLLKKSNCESDFVSFCVLPFRVFVTSHLGLLKCFF